MTPSTTSRPKEVYVYIYLPGKNYVPAGLLTHDPDLGRYQFGYGQKYRRLPDAIPLSPVRLPLSLETPVAFRDTGCLPNVFEDVAPDSWGRRLLSLYCPTAIESLPEIDILTAVHEPHRIGALAFGPDLKGPASMAEWYDGPSLMKPVNDLELIAGMLAKIETHFEEGTLAQLRDDLSSPLFRAMAFSGSLVGGSRPKALYTDPQGGEWIAKFPKLVDAWNDPMLEHALMQLARDCGIQTAETQIVTTNDMNILLVRRFDRDEGNRPQHIISGLTLADRRKDDEKGWGSYQGLAQAARRHGDVDAGPELFRRMAFNVLCKNTDDHPKNHAFFVTRGHVRMTPAYDITPAVQGYKDARKYMLALRCGKLGARPTLENVLSDVRPFGLTLDQARGILHDMLQVAKDWRPRLEASGAASKDLDMFKDRFSESERALPERSRGGELER